MRAPNYVIPYLTAQLATAFRLAEVAMILRELRASGEVGWHANRRCGAETVREVLGVMIRVSSNPGKITCEVCAKADM